MADMNCMSNFDCDCCHNELNLDKLCVKKVKACNICVKDINVERSFCAPLVSSPAVCARQVTANQIDAQSAFLASSNVGSECVQNSTVTNLNAVNAVINDLCVPGKFSAMNFVPSTKYRATVNFSAPITTYTLGSFMNFNNIIDDPNNNVSLVPNTSYTAPLSGYYMFTYKVNIQNLQSSDPVLGAPVASLEVFVNGVLAREGYFPFLTFFNEQKALTSSLISLNAGDVVTLKYNVLAGNGVPVVGTVDIVGSAVEDGNSLFKIILISGMSSGPVPCQPVVPCSQVMPATCVPCVPISCDSGEPCVIPAPMKPSVMQQQQKPVDRNPEVSRLQAELARASRS